uniref:Uncharacterized protein n=1 Tax=Hordeum vulgare subsp. vulgare TaxID=112509 RepID=A0A8I6XMR2_HORVV
MLSMVAVQILMTALGVLLMDKAGRRPLLMVKKIHRFLDSRKMMHLVMDSKAVISILRAEWLPERMSGRVSGRLRRPR